MTRSRRAFESAGCRACGRIAVPADLASVDALFEIRRFILGKIVGHAGLLRLCQIVLGATAGESDRCQQCKTDIFQLVHHRTSHAELNVEVRISTPDCQISPSARTMQPQYPEPGKCWTLKKTREALCSVLWLHAYR